MAAWKQLLLALRRFVAAAAAWVKFFPGAPEILARWGIEWAQAASRARQRPDGGEPGDQRRDSGAADGGGHRAGGRRPTINDKLSAIGTGRAEQLRHRQALHVRPADQDRASSRARGSRWAR